jgi:hypothetical protein
MVVVVVVVVCRTRPGAEAELPPVVCECVVAGAGVATGAVVAGTEVGVAPPTGAGLVRRDPAPEWPLRERAAGPVVAGAP